MALSEYLGLYLPDPQLTPDELFDIDTIINDSMEAIDKEIRKYSRVFTSVEWVINENAADGYKASITVGQSVHKLDPKTGRLDWRARLQSNGTYLPNAWAALETIVLFDASTKIITIKATSAYSGDILITG